MTSINTILSIAASGMLSQQFNLDVISNNVANVNTAGYRRSRVEFADVVYAQSGVASEELGLPVAGVRVAATRTIFAPGTWVSSGSHLDLAIDGEGYFQVLLPDGSTGYTRSGTFSLDAQGRLVNSEGLVLLPEIRFDVPAENVDISSDGRVFVRQNDEITEVGQITLARFAEPAGLEAVGHGAFRETAASGAPVAGAPETVGFGSLVQGTLELSNVDLAEEMVNMITAQRAYQMSSRAAQVADEMMQVANQIQS
ncbi:MAG: flagellar basal-body rod protein FlgG [Chloroflexota bacterium]